MSSQINLVKAEIKALLKAKNPSIGQRIDRVDLEIPLAQKGFSAATIQDAIYVLMDEGFLDRYTDHRDKNWFSDVKVTASGSINWINRVIEPKRFRLEVLKAHYDLANGGMMVPVMISSVAASLGINDYDDPTLRNAILFLEDKGYLKSVDNMDSSITTSGIEEVESDFQMLQIGSTTKSASRTLVDENPYKNAKDLVEKIKEVMIDAATGTSIRDKNGEYKMLYRQLDSELLRLEINNPNEFSDLWEFQTYWKAQGMSTYAERRAYVAQLYKNLFSKAVGYNNPTDGFVSANRIGDLKLLNNKDFDLAKLVKLCEELNVAFKHQCYFATALLTRAIIDHVPPIFSKSTFTEVASNYGTKSFKDSMSHLDKSSRKISDGHLHTQIRSKESLPNSIQVNFSNDLDVLLAEIYRFLK